MRRSTRQTLAHIAANLREARLRLDLTQEEFAERAEVDARQLQRIEAGEVDLRVSTVVKIAEALGMESGQLFKKSEPTVRKTGRPPKTGRRTGSRVQP